MPLLNFPVDVDHTGAEPVKPDAGSGDQPLSSTIAASPEHGLSKETYIAVFTGAGLLAYLITRYLFGVAGLRSDWILIFILVAAGGPLLYDLARKAAACEFGSDLLAGISIVTSAILGEYLAGSIVVLMLSGGTALEHYATRKASSVLAAVAKRMPRVAHRRSGSQIREVSLEEVRPGDTLIVFPHEICPADGVVSEGRGTMDESYLTGEPFQIAKVRGSAVLSGALNGDAALTITVTHLPADSRYAKIMRVMQEAETNRPRFRRIADRLGAWYTLVALATAAVGWIAGHDASRFLAVLVIATPCPLLLAVPVAIVGAISVAASRGIVIKNPSVLERIDTCRTVILDKTGTLTYGKPSLADVFCAPGFQRREVLRIASGLEQYSKHPLAAGVLEAAEKESIQPAQVSQISEKPGEGLSGYVESRAVRIIGRKQVGELGEGYIRQLPPPGPGMECVLLVNGKYAATFRFLDAPRTESRFFIGHLAPRHHITKIVLLSGDKEAEVRHLAQQVGISNVLFGKSPEEKVEAVRREAGLHPTLFLGDGVNDAPAMQAATVGIAFGQSSDITAEAADAVVLETSLERVDELMHVARRMRRIALESAVGGMLLSMLGMLFAAAGYLPPVAGAIAQEIIDAAAVLNALRVLLPAGKLQDCLPDAR